MKHRNEHEDPFVNLVRDVLVDKWDPVCIGSNPNLRDEYDAYLAPLVTTLLEPCVSKSSIVEYLLAVERGKMGMRGDADRAAVVADALLRLVDK
jgi:hypothetical protein